MGWNLVDSLYMMIITVATLGHGTAKKRTEAGEMHTIVLAFASYTVFAST